MLLLKVKVNRNFPQCIIAALSTVGSLGLISIEIEQLLESISLITALIYLSTLYSHLLQDSLELIQLEAKLSTLVLEIDYELFTIFFYQTIPKFIYS